MAVVKSNKLIETGYSLPAREQLFVLYLISQVSSADDNFEEYAMHWKDIEKILNFDGKRRISKKKEVFQMMNTLNTRPIKWENEDEIGQTAWISSMRMNKGTEVFQFQLAQELRPYLLHLKEHFTRFSLQYVVYLKTNNIRFYELMKRYEFQKEFELEVDHIRFCLGFIDEAKGTNKYSDACDFRRKIIKSAQQELEEFTDIRFEFEVARKRGKTPVSYLFKVYKNTPTKRYETPKLLAAPRKKTTVSKTFYSTKQKGTLEERLVVLSRAKLKAYDFLTQKGVNHGVVLDAFFPHPNLGHEIAKGFEDVYARLAFTYIEEHSKAESKAAAFVSWWKNGHLTKAVRHAQLIDRLIEIQRNMNQDEKDYRQIAASMTEEEYVTYLANRKTINDDAHLAQAKPVNNAIEKLRQKFKTN